MSPNKDQRHETARPRQVSSTCKTNSETSFTGVRRRRWGRYVSEIRLPGKKTRVWLGSFESAETAARAYDSAALFLKGESANLNFPHLAHKLPRPESCSRTDIQLAASKAAHYSTMEGREGCELAGELSGSDFEIEDSFWDELLKTTHLDIDEAPPIISSLKFELVMGEKVVAQWHKKQCN